MKSKINFLRFAQIVNRQSKIVHHLIALLVLCMSACTLDNFDEPDAPFYGSIIDKDTFEPIQQDLFEGARIDYVEQGFKNPNTRQIRFQTDGTFRENNLFSGTYEMQALRGNFYPTVKETIELNGATEHIFVARPYIRIKDVSITFDETKGEVTAEFTMEPVLEDPSSDPSGTNPVASVRLFADRNPNLSNTLRAFSSGLEVNAAVQPDQKFTIKMSTLEMVSGKERKEYYFRVAALIAE